MTTATPAPTLRKRQEVSTFEHRLRGLVRWGVYPLSWLVVMVTASFAYHEQVEWGTAWVSANTILVLGYILIETYLPYQRRWGATWPSFRTDVKYFLMNGGFLGLVKLGLGLFAINMSGQTTGIASNWPLWLQVVAALLVFDALQYSVHRYMHCHTKIGTGKWSSFFWRVHSAHHIPQKLYVTMHVIGHPLNGLLIQTLVIVLPIWWMGYSEAACTLFLMINAIHGLMSHFNVDVRMGWMNYLFVGTELHRYHHSSAFREAKNFGAVLSIYDQLFGTFVYKPGIAPAELGAFNEDSYPDYHSIGKTLRFPFEGEQTT